MNERVTLTVLVIRTALGGLALVNDLDLDTLDDLRQAADEACDCLMHQGAPARSLRLEAWSEGGKLRGREPQPVDRQPLRERRIAGEIGGIPALEQPVAALDKKRGGLHAAPPFQNFQFQPAA